MASTTSQLLSKNIVIIGNGGAGSQLTAALHAAIPKSHRAHKITVISPLEYSEISPMMTKVVAVGAEEHAKSIFPSFREPDVEYVVDSCAELKTEAVVTKGGRTVPFDACIICTGHKYPIFLPGAEETSEANRKSYIAQLNQRVRDAKNIVISGGGAVGCEVAADIKLRYKDIKVTVIDSHATAMNAMSSMFGPIANRELEKIGIELVLNDRVVQQDSDKVILKSKRQIQCDLFIPAHPDGANATFLPAVCLDERKYIRVNDYFQLDHPNYSKVFAIGDCSNYDPIKTFIRLGDQVPSMTNNIILYLDNQPMKPHKRGASFQAQISGPAMVSFGHGVPGMVGIGPDMPGCLGYCCWFCCCCQPPHGIMTANMKTNFNTSIKPQVGKGLAPG